MAASARSNHFMQGKSGPARYTHTLTSAVPSNQSPHESNQEDKFEDTNLNPNTQQDNNNNPSDSEADNENSLSKLLNTQPINQLSENHESREDS